MAVKPGFKMTDAGTIPLDWDVQTLKMLSEQIMVGIASAATHAYRKKGVPFLRNQNIKPGYLDEMDVLYIDPESELTFKNKRLKAGDLLTARTGYPGTTCIVPLKYESAQSFTTLITRPKQQIVDSNYLCQYINSEKGQSFFEKNQIGGGQKNVNAGSLQSMIIPMPALSEQRAIATALSDVDALIAALDRLIAKKRDIKQAAMQELLTGKRRLAGFESKKGYKQTEIGLIPDDWDYKPIGNEIDLLTGFPFSSGQYANYGIRLLRGSNIKRGVTDWSDDITKFWTQVTPDLKTYLLSEGDLVIAMDGSLVGRSYAQITKADLPALLLQRVARIRSQKIDTAYLKEFVGSDWFVKYSDQVKTVTAIPHISSNDIRNFSIPIPSTINEQHAITSTLSDMSSEIDALEIRRKKTCAIKQGMMQELLTGRIRLVQGAEA